MTNWLRYFFRPRLGMLSVWLACTETGCMAVGQFAWATLAAVAQVISHIVFDGVEDMPL